MKNKFLSAAWKHLVMANYAVDPALLKPYLPTHTELDYWQDKVYVSLVGFMFQQTKVRGISIPFHANFEEVNLRFYVRYNDNGTWRRGVVFISEIAPRSAIAFVANTFFNENYRTCRMRHVIGHNQDKLQVSYEWRYKGNWNSLSVVANPSPQSIVADSEAEFITEHYWGYSKRSATKTVEYAVEHPRWNIYPVESYSINCRFGEVYGNAFAHLEQVLPDSVLLADGSVILVGDRRVIMN